MTPTAHAQQHSHESHGVIGFWIYILSDCLLFACLFATYAVLQGNTYGGPGARELFSLPFVLGETLLLLTSSFTCGLGLLAAHKHKLPQSVLLLSLTAILGLAFLHMEMNEFSKLLAEGNSWARSGFLSAFFTLLGTHGLHVIIGIAWMLVLVTQILRNGFTDMNIRQLMSLSLFWHFLDIVWIFIFSFVYLIGAL